MLKRRSIILMIVFFVLTLGLYYPIWFLRRRAALNGLDSPRKLQRWPFLLLLAIFVFQLIAAIASAPARPEETVGGGSLLFLLIRLAAWILIVVQCFIIKDILEDHLAGPDDTISSSVLSNRVYLSGLMTFFFHVFYLQYVINRHIAGSQQQPA